MERKPKLSLFSDNLNVKEDVDALHTTSSEILGCSNELSSKHQRNYVTVIHLRQVKLDTKKIQDASRD